MGDDTQTAIKVARLEAQVEHLTSTVDAMATKLDEVHNLLMQARGARWAILGIAALGGFFASKIGNLLPWLVSR